MIFFSLFLLIIRCALFAHYSRARSSRTNKIHHYDTQYIAYTHNNVLLSRPKTSFRNISSSSSSPRGGTFFFFTPVFSVSRRRQCACCCCPGYLYLNFFFSGILFSFFFFFRPYSPLHTVQGTRTHARRRRRKSDDAITRARIFYALYAFERLRQRGFVIIYKWRGCPERAWFLKRTRAVHCVHEGVLKRALIQYSCRGPPEPAHRRPRAFLARRFTKQQREYVFFFLAFISKTKTERKKRIDDDIVNDSPVSSPEIIFLFYCIIIPPN